MAAVTIRNLSEEAHRALKVRAAEHNRSTEAEMRAILEAAVRPEGRLLLGTALSTEAAGFLVSTAGTRVPVELSAVPLKSGERVVGVFGLLEERSDDTL